MTAELRRLGDRLRAAGLTARALAAWAGTERLVVLPARRSALLARPPVPAAAALAVFVAGAERPIDQLRGLPIDELVAAGLVERTGELIRARAAVLPLGEGLLVCDRADAPREPALVCWPDDSSYHMASALPAGRRARWLDLGCGSAFAALVRPDAAAHIVGVDLNERAVAYARLGLALSGIEHAEVIAGDAAADHGTAELVTCNAPIPGDPHAAIWRRTDAGFFPRLVAAIPARLAPGGLAIIHSIRASFPDAMPGERVFVAYSPGDPAFGLLWWRPDAAPREVEWHRPLTVARPHLEPGDRDAALAADSPGHHQGQRPHVK